MSTYERKGFFEKMGAFVPGYKGYSEKELRRKSDAILREAIVTRLTDRRRIVDDLIRDWSKDMKFDLLEDLESLKRRIDQVSDTIRHAEQGYSAKFDVVQIKNEDLDKLYRFDLGLLDSVQEFEKGMGELPTSKDSGAALRAMLKVITELGETVRKRSEAITEVV